MRALKRLLVASSIVCASPAFGQAQVGIKPSFTDADGRQAVFNVQFPDAPPLQAGAVDSATIAAEFKRICFDSRLDPARLQAAAAESTLALAPSQLRFVGDRNTPAFDIMGWHGRSADVRIWTGDPRALRRLPFFVVDSGVTITGPMRNLLPQCNLAVHSSALSDFNALVAAISSTLGLDAPQAKSGRRWGQANWRGSDAAGSYIIGLRVDDLHRPGQTLHLGIIYLPRASNS